MVTLTTARSPNDDVAFACIGMRGGRAIDGGRREPLDGDAWFANDRDLRDVALVRAQVRASDLHDSAAISRSIVLK